MKDESRVKPYCPGIWCVAAQMPGLFFDYGN